MANKDDYLNLIASAYAQSLKDRMTRLEATSVKHTEQINMHTKLFLDSIEDDIAFTAKEVLKWAIKKPGVVEGECLYYFDANPEVMRMVFLACHAYGAFGPNPDMEGLACFKVISQEIIQARNGVAHCQGLAALERKVRKCITAINAWPHLKTQYPNQTRVTLVNGEEHVLIGSLDLNQGKILPGEIVGNKPEGPNADRERGYLSNVCVAPLMCQRGIGVALLQQAQKIARLWGITSLYVHVVATNDAAVKLYNKGGFSLEKEESASDARRQARPRRSLLHKFI